MIYNINYEVEKTMIKPKQPLTAIETVRKELSRILCEQMQCVDEYGIVRTYSRNKYNELTKEAKLYKESLDLLQEFKRRST